MESIFYIFLLTTGASFVQRTTGFGFGIFIMTMLPFLMPSYGEATALSGLLALTTSALISFRMKKYITWKRLLPILLTFIIISSGAICLLARIQDQTLRKILGVALIITALYKNHYMAMAQTYFLIGNSIMTIVRASNGFVTPTVGRCYLFCLAAVGIGTIMGSWAFRHIPAKIFPYIVYTYIGVSGLVIFITS